MPYALRNREQQLLPSLWTSIHPIIPNKSLPNISLTSPYCTPKNNILFLTLKTFSVFNIEMTNSFLLTNVQRQMVISYLRMKNSKNLTVFSHAKEEIAWSVGTRILISFTNRSWMRSKACWKIKAWTYPCFLCCLKTENIKTLEIAQIKVQVPWLLAFTLFPGRTSFQPRNMMSML